ncbi:MAG: DNA replication and repair protein RecF [Bifidobacteriaceae bacterium]|nr:DNA replication and repair protein RecF [Bifidobacteriaceae bacterium]MCI1914774.1 DNA replication and repair protein RecF [Bifidobacteriaceae bacterium]
MFDFAPGINVLVGKNGIGKTNVVEAIEFLASGTSHRASASKFLVQRGEHKATIRANVTHVGEDVAAESRASDGDHDLGSEQQRTLEVTIPQRGAVRSRVDSGPSRYFRDIAGQLKVVFFSPRDQQLVSGDPSQRRSFLDSTATMMFPDYYALVQRFRQIAKQRTAVLKRLADFAGQPESSESQPSAFDARSMTLSELEVWTSQFIDVGVEITQRRAEVLRRLAGSFTRLYSELSDDNGVAEIAYEPSFAEALEDARDDGEPDPTKQLIAQHFQRIYPGEVTRGSNLIGPHRDDVLITLDGEPAREFASNGELWTVGLALKMAQFDYLSQQDAPILVLDDVFAQLDESRRHQILDFAAHQQQVFITVAAHSDIPPVDGSTLIDVEEIAARSAGESPEAMLASLMPERGVADSKKD